jgi:hypothetical protein
LLLAENAVITVSLTLGTSGSNVGFIQSANYVPGSTGFLIRADGYAEFNDVLVRGKFATVSEVFNPAAPNTTFPTTSYLLADIEGPTATLGVGGTIIGPFLTMQGWLVPGQLPNTYFGKAASNFIIAVNGGYTVASGYADTDIMYRKNGGAWVQVDRAAVRALDNNGGANMTVGLSLTGLIGTDVLQFAIKASADNNATTYNAMQMSVMCFNL